MPQGGEPQRTAVASYTSEKQFSSYATLSFDLFSVLHCGGKNPYPKCFSFEEAKKGHFSGWLGNLSNPAWLFLDHTLTTWGLIQREKLSPGGSQGWRVSFSHHVILEPSTVSSFCFELKDNPRAGHVMSVMGQVWRQNPYLLTGPGTEPCGPG